MKKSLVARAMAALALLAASVAAQPIWTNQDTSVNDTLTLQTAAASFTSSAALKNKIVIFEIDASALDVANSFVYVAAQTGASNAANDQLGAQ